MINQSQWKDVSTSEALLILIGVHVEEEDQNSIARGMESLHYDSSESTCGKQFICEKGACEVTTRRLSQAVAGYGDPIATNKAEYKEHVIVV